MRERRRAVRRHLQWQATIEGSDPTGAQFGEQGVIENLSSTGAFLYMSREVAIGSRLDLAIRLPFEKENWMKYSAEVVRVEAATQKIGIGIRFDDLRPTFISG